MNCVIDTHLGPVVSECVIDEWNDGAGEAVREESDRVIRSAKWLGPTGSTIRLVVVRLALPDNEAFEPLSGYVGVVWGFRAAGALDPWNISLRHDGPDGGPDCGELLEAVTYDTADFRMTIGTHDDEGLVRRAKAQALLWGAPLPPLWETELGEPWEGEYGARSSDGGIELRLPGLAAGESALIHFAIAWGPQGTEQNAAAWYAADTTPDRILAEANLSVTDLTT